MEFSELFDGCCGAAAPKASPGGKLAQNRLFGTDFVTDEECGQKCFVFYAVTGFFLHFRYRRSSSVFFIALSGGDEKSTFPPGKALRLAAPGGMRSNRPTPICSAERQTAIYGACASILLRKMGCCQTTTAQIAYNFMSMLMVRIRKPHFW